VSRYASQRGISLIELLVSIIILAIAVAAMLPVASSSIKLSASSEKLAQQFLTAYYLTDLGKAKAVSAGNNLTSETLQTPYGPFNISYSTAQNVVNIETKWLTGEEYKTSILPPTASITVSGVHIKILSPSSGSTVSGTFTLTVESYGYINGEKYQVDGITARVVGGDSCNLTSGSGYNYTFTCSAPAGRFVVEAVATYAGMQGITRINLIGAQTGSLVVEIVSPTEGGYVTPSTFNATVAAYESTSNTPASSVTLSANNEACTLLNQTGYYFAFSCPAPDTDGSIVKLEAQASLGALNGNDSVQVSVRNRIELSVVRPSTSECLPPASTATFVINSEHLYGPEAIPLQPTVVKLEGNSCNLDQTNDSLFYYKCDTPRDGGIPVSLEVTSATSGLTQSISETYHTCCSGSFAVYTQITKEATGTLLHATRRKRFLDVGTSTIYLSARRTLEPNRDKFCGQPAKDGLLELAAQKVNRRWPFARVNSISILKKHGDDDQTTICYVEEFVFGGNNHPDVTVDCRSIGNDYVSLITEDVGGYPILTHYKFRDTVVDDVDQSDKRERFIVEIHDNRPLIYTLATEGDEAYYIFGDDNNQCPYCNSVYNGFSYNCKAYWGCKYWYRSIKYQFTSIIYRFYFSYLDKSTSQQVSDTKTIQLSNTCNGQLEATIKVEWDGYISKIDRTNNVLVHIEQEDGQQYTTGFSWDSGNTRGSQTKNINIDLQQPGTVKVWFEYKSQDPEATVTVTLTGTVTYQNP